jgi:hypothetical protein
MSSIAKGQADSDWELVEQASEDNTESWDDANNSSDDDLSAEESFDPPGLKVGKAKGNWLQQVSATPAQLATAFVNINHYMNCIVSVSCCIW